MTRLFIADVRSPSGPRPLVTVRAASEAEALLFLEARYPDDRIESVAEPAEWSADTETGSAPGDIREHPGSTWQAPGGVGQAPGRVEQAPGGVGQAPGWVEQAPGET